MPETLPTTEISPTTVRMRLQAAAAATAGGLFGGLRCLASPAASTTVVAFSPGHGSWDRAQGAEPDHG
jgi:hypothetical protein